MNTLNSDIFSLLFGELPKTKDVHSFMTTCSYLYGICMESSFVIKRGDVVLGSEYSSALTLQVPNFVVYFDPEDIHFKSIHKTLYLHTMYPYLGRDVIMYLSSTTRTPVTDRINKHIENKDHIEWNFSSLHPLKYKRKQTFRGTHETRFLDGPNREENKQVVRNILKEHSGERVLFICSSDEWEKGYYEGRKFSSNSREIRTYWKHYPNTPVCVNKTYIAVMDLCSSKAIILCERGNMLKTIALSRKFRHSVVVTSDPIINHYFSIDSMLFEELYVVLQTNKPILRVLDISLDLLNKCVTSHEKLALFYIKSINESKITKWLLSNNQLKGITLEELHTVSVTNNGFRYGSIPLNI